MHYTEKGILQCTCRFYKIMIVPLGPDCGDSYGFYGKREVPVGSTRL